MILESVPVGMLGVNCYIVGEKDSLLVIDPGADANRIFERIQSIGGSVKTIFLTHCHFDHILAVNDLKNLTGAKIVVPKAEKQNLSDENVNMTGRFHSGKINILPDEFVSEGDVVEAGMYRFSVLETPGHTSGGACLYEPKESILFSGDTLFFESIGRTDFLSGDFDALKRSVLEKLYVLPGETRVYPGHGDATTIAHEMKNNPFISI